MKGLRFLLLLFCVISSGAVFSQDSGHSAEHPGIFVWFTTAEADTALFTKELNHSFPNSVSWQIEKAFISREVPLNRIWTVKGFETEEVSALLQVLSRIQAIELAEEIPVFEFDHTPNDLNAKQWNLKKIKAEKAWDIGKGSPSVVVALIDDGLDTAHTDLQPMVWHNPKEIPGNKMDDDGNGWTDDFFGWDVADNDNDPSVKVADKLNHGTHCAGIINTATNNNTGLAGIGYQARIMAIKAGQANVPYLSNPYRGVDYAMINGARIISMSWGSKSYSYTYDALFEAAWKKGILCVAAAGNTVIKGDDTVRRYPAAYDYVLAVGATDSADKRSYFSCNGSWVDVMAPGSDIYSTLPGNQYGYMNGTSMACPLVSGMAALMVSKNPLQKVDELKNCIISGCVNIDNLNSGYAGRLGAGRIDAESSMQCVKTIRARILSSKKRVCTGDTVKFYDNSTGTPVSWMWYFSGGSPSASTQKNPVVTYSSDGVYTVKLVVSNGTESDSIELMNYISTGKPTLKFSGVQTVTQGDYGTITAALAGTGPWDITYTNGKDTFTINKITESPYYILVLTDSSKVYKPVSVFESGCRGQVSDSFKLNVLKKGTTLCDSVVRFQMRWGGSGDEEIYRIAFYDDTTVILAGRTKSYGPGDYTSFLAMVTVNGQRKWFKTYGGSADDGFYSVVIDNNKDIHAAGYTFSNTNGKSVIFIKTDKNGNMLWKKHYDGSSWELIRNGILSRNKKFIYYAGPSISNSYGSEDFTVYKVDTSGTVLWAKQIGDSEFNRNDGIWEDSMGNIFTVGTQGNNWPYMDGILTKLDASGAVKFTKKYHYTAGGYNEIMEKIVVWKERAFFVYGFAGQFNGSSNTTQEYMLMRLDTSGNLVWSKKYTLGTGNTGGLEILGDHLYLTAYTSNNGGDALVMKLDTNGNILNAQTLGNSSQQAPFDIIKATDGSFYVCGHDRTSGNSDLFLAKSNCKLDFLCNSKSATPSVSNMAVTVANRTYNSRDFSTAKTAAISVATHTPTVSFVCKSKNYNIRNQCNLQAEYQTTPACTGEPVTFKDLSQDYAGYTPKQWFWDFGDSTSASGKQTVTHTYSKNGNYTVRLIVRSENGQYSCLDTVKYVYRSADSFRIKKMIPDAVICFNDSVQFAKIQTYCGESPFFYSWSPSYGISDTTAAQPFFSPKIKTKYRVKITDFNGISIADSFIVDIDYKCCVSVPRFAVKNNLACENSPVYFVNESSHKKNAVFKWVFTGASIASYTGFEPPGVTYGSSGNYPVQLILTDSCTKDTFQSMVYVAPIPVAFAGEDTALCFPDTITLGGGGMAWYNYEWTPATGMQNPNVADPQVVVNQPVKYHLKVVSDEQCVGYDSVTILNFNKKPELGKDTIICSDQNLILSGGVAGEKYLWSTGDTTAMISVNKPGSYWLKTSKKTCTYGDTIIVYGDSVPLFDLGRDTSVCEIPGELDLKPMGLYNSYTKLVWDNAGTSPIRKISSAGTYWLEITNNLCVFRDTIRVQFDSMPDFTLGSDTQVCQTLSGHRLVPKGAIPFTGTYLWHTGAITDNILVYSSGNYRLKISNGHCSSSDTVNFVVDSMPLFNLGPDSQLCITGMPLQLTAKNPAVRNATTLWENGTTGIPRNVPAAGLYWLQMKNGICIFKDSILIRTDTIPLTDLGKDTSYCETAGNLIIGPKLIHSTWSYLWNTGATTAQTGVSQSGIYSLVSTNGKCSDSDTITVVKFSNPSFTLGPDTIICNEKFPHSLAPVNLQTPVTGYLWDNNTTGSTRQINGPGIFMLTVFNGKCAVTSNIRIDTLSVPVQDLGPDTAICVGDTLELFARNYPATTFLWSQGSISQSIHVTKGGNYSLEASNICGKSSDEILVKEKDCSCPVYIPNSFTPGRSGGLNDQFSVVLDCPVDEFEIQIYNRWGNLLFRSTDTAFAWDGRANGSRVPAGAYYGIVRIKSRLENGGHEFYRTGVIYVLE